LYSLIFLSILLELLLKDNYYGKGNINIKPNVSIEVIFIVKYFFKRGYFYNGNFSKLIKKVFDEKK